MLVNEDSVFLLLHAVRVRGRGHEESLRVLSTDADTILPALVDQGFLRQRSVAGRPEWSLTKEGRTAHDEHLAVWRQREPLDELSSVYDGFLVLNPRFKAIITTWQQAGATDDETKFGALDDLVELHESAVVVLERAGALISRFADYARRLQEALDKVDAGEHRYMSSPAVDSYHTVWFELHEDFLLTLGIDRATEGSF